MQTEALAALMQLASPALPVGAFSYSQGLEFAVETGRVHDAATAQAWIFDAVELVVARHELPIWMRLHAAWSRHDVDAIAHWNALFVASRETRELREETVQMGYSLDVLLRELGLRGPDDALVTPCAWPTAHARACVALGLAARPAAAAYLYAVVENQVMAAVKAVPLGQTAAQRMLLAAHPRIARAVEHAETLDDDALGSAAVGVAWNSARHETQYSRLFRS